MVHGGGDATEERLFVGRHAYAAVQVDGWTRYTGCARSRCFEGQLDYSDYFFALGRVHRRVAVSPSLASKSAALSVPLKAGSSIETDRNGPFSLVFFQAEPNSTLPCAVLPTIL